MELIKLIQHNASGVNNPDDFSYPWRLDAYFRPPSFMSVAFICLYGGQEIIQVRGITKKSLEEFAKKNNLFNHPRKQSIKIWQPEKEKGENP